MIKLWDWIDLIKMFEYPKDANNVCNICQDNTAQVKTQGKLPMTLLFL